MLEIVHDGDLDAEAQLAVFIPCGGGGRRGCSETGCERVPSTAKVRLVQAVLVYSEGMVRRPVLANLGLPVVSRGIILQNVSWM
jgi:hypothetical protein